MRTRLLTAACAFALLGGAAAAQETQPPVNDPVSPPANTTDGQDPAETPVDPIPTGPEVAAPTPPTTPADAAVPETPGAVAEVQPGELTDGSIVDVLREQGNFTTLISALEATNLDDVLASDDSITILAPTDEAFAALPEADRQRLMDPANRQELQQLLLYHVINADVRRDQIENRRGAVETGSGAQIMLDGGGGVLRADAATITSTELRGSNGAVFVLDQVLNPETSLAGMGDVEAADAPATTDADEAEGQPMPMTPPTDTAPDDPVQSDDEDPTTIEPE
ncbi:fasciclin domain-containing protein [Brevundimonas sp.]|uniref:fasciclin domain-containing protein n=1 Tax=Brevundimonas sp. TaxID=1871086 RepID=UPI0025ECF0AF|nr:fasciclin domain-containing protein [Brevundimonas sp.]